MEEEIRMPKKKIAAIPSGPRWMNQCDVIKYNLQIPQELKEQLIKEALGKNMDTSEYICGLLAGDIKRKKPGKKG
jgi:hypothetical protein